MSTSAYTLNKRLERIRRELSSIAEDLRVIAYRKGDDERASNIMAAAHIDGAIFDLTLAIGQRKQKT